MATKWNINSNQSEVLIKTKSSVVGYFDGVDNHFEGFVYVENNQVEEASITFYIDNNTNTNQLDTVGTAFVKKIYPRKNLL